MDKELFDYLEKRFDSIDDELKSIDNRLSKIEQRLEDTDVDIAGMKLTSQWRTNTIIDSMN